MERRLAAILAADVVGYSRLMEADEAGTLAQLKTHRIELIDPAVAGQNGRIFKTMGDGILVEFASVVDAVQCAVEVQRGMAERNARVPEDRRILFRIGINLGDIIIDTGDIYGDGVNIAARLEGLADAGGILISGTVYDHLKAKVAVGYEDLGARRVKNISEPVRVYRVLTEPGASGAAAGRAKKQPKPWLRPSLAAGLAALVAAAGAAVWLEPRTPAVEPASIEKMAFPLPEKPSIAVLPFDDLSGDAGQGHVADGLTEDIITRLSQISSLFVIARHSTFAYKGKPVKVQQVAEDLGVRYVLEGSVRTSGGQIRINAQLIDALTGIHLWAERYDRNMTEL